MTRYYVPKKRNTRQVNLAKKNKQTTTTQNKPESDQAPGSNCQVNGNEGDNRTY